MAEERGLKELDVLRRRIDEIDEALVKLLSARAECALAIGREKKALGMELYQPSREKDVLEHVQRVNGGPLDDGAIKRLFERVIDEARRLERIADAAKHQIGSAEPHSGAGASGDRHRQD
jgi:chorismate mutase